VVVDEGSTNGTFVGAERVPPNTSRVVRSGDAVRVGRLWLVIQLDHGPVTRDVAAATRDLALALVARALAAGGVEQRPRVRVVEGADSGASVVLAIGDRDYVVGRGANCHLALADADVSREHTAFVLRGGAVLVRDLASKNGTWLDGERLPSEREVSWRQPQMLRIGQTLLVLEEPLDEQLGPALADAERAPDEPLDDPPDATPPPPPMPGRLPLDSAPSPPSAEPVPARRRMPARWWTLLDVAVMSAALLVLAASLAGLVWLLRR
jgi:pSer/pThr/pTyr-binding forkhead associated (FHA) protein